MSRSFHEPVDPFDIFDAATAAEVQADRDRKRAEALRRNAEEAAKDQLRQEEARARSAVLSRTYNTRDLLGEYHSAGVEPLSVDGNGRPTTSLSLLLSIGWTIIDLSGEKRLIEPKPLRAHQTRSREDYAGEGS